MKTSACKQDPGLFIPIVNFGKCEGKGDCLDVFPENVFEIRRIDTPAYKALGLLAQIKLRLHGMQVAYTPNTDACRACGLCVTACPEKAISLSSPSRLRAEVHEPEPR
ncbi:4Fe-4S binding protein [Undibacterium sp. TJN19]|uniref:4Fe-4S binding protein n=1 Tax=Undibacterium sp. TJN19 TaxID=3413055 RepID=UPI003BF1FE42